MRRSMRWWSYYHRNDKQLKYDFIVPATKVRLSEPAGNDHQNIPINPLSVFSCINVLHFDCIFTGVGFLFPSFNDESFSNSAIHQFSMRGSALVPMPPTGGVLIVRCWARF